MQYRQASIVENNYEKLWSFAAYSGELQPALA